jgi:hypothetical protein
VAGGDRAYAITMRSKNPPDEGLRGRERIPAGDLICFEPTIRIGVTGHRDLADSEQASAAAADALSHLLTVLETAKWPTGMVRWTASPGRVVGYRVVSPLAEGADRVVAALVRSSDTRFADRVRELVVPLPFAIDYYRGRDGQPGSDCQDPQSQAEFDRLRSAARWARPLHPFAPADADQRDAWYQDVGTYVVRHCDFLFALWDGRDNGRSGGTAAVVRYAWERGTPVIWIPVARKGAAGPAPAGGAPADAAPAGAEAQLLTGFPETDVGLASGFALPSPQAQAAIAGGRAARQQPPGFLLERFGRLAELCRYAERDRRVDQTIKKEMTTATLVPDSGANAAAVRAVADWIIPAYAVADGLAKRYQRLLKTLNIGVYAAAAAAVALGAFAAILFPYQGNWRLPVVFEASVLISLFLVQALDIRRKCRDRWVAFRAMSEYFRVGRFLALVSTAEPRGLQFDRFTRLYSWSSEPYLVPWFAPVIERAWECRPDLDLRDTDVPWLRSYLIDNWIGDQISYHESRRKTHLHWDKIFLRTIQLILLVTVLAVVVHVALDYIPHHPEKVWEKTAVTVAFLSIALTSLAAAFNGYSGLQRHSYHAVRFGRMEKELKEVKSSLCRATTIAQLEDHLRVARRIMLGETTEWYEGMEQQLIESPA